MFQVKICGITTADDACMAAGAGADAIGLNFYPESKRYVDAETARTIASAVPAGVVKVGLFVNAEPALILQTARALKLDLVQLHGDEPPEVVARLEGLPVMRAFRVGEEGLAPIVDYLRRCLELGSPPKMVLLDSQVAGSYGGTGQVADWKTVARFSGEWPDTPMVLAGGLTAENVATAIEAVRPSAVDTASGVELSPGRKSAELVRVFVEAARRALSPLT